MELNYTLIGLRIKKVRQAKRLTRDKLSEMSEISPQHLSPIEIGKTKLSLPTLIKICNALDITSDALLYDLFNVDSHILTNEIASVYSDCSSDEIFF